MPAERRAHLDGVRGLAILLVLVDHFLIKAGHLEKFASTIGSIGVHVFFGLSGYLITGILLRERAATGRIGLRRFYARRALRILPAFYVSLAFVAVLAALTVTVDATAAQLAIAGTFLGNSSPIPLTWWVGHTWTLAVEEQFYLLWPLLLVRLRPRRALTVAVAVLAAEPVIRCVTYALVPWLRAGAASNLHMQADALLWGAALALLPVAHPDAYGRLTGVVRRYRLGFVALGVLAVNECASAVVGLGYQLPIGLSLEGAAIALLLVGAEQPGRLRTGLAWRPLVGLGLISYSLYLWQQPFTAPFWASGPLSSLPLCVLLAFGCAIASRYLIERPSLRWKHRYEPVVTGSEPRPDNALHV